MKAKSRKKTMWEKYCYNDGIWHLVGRGEYAELIESTKDSYYRIKIVSEKGTVRYLNKKELRYEERCL